MKLKLDFALSTLILLLASASTSSIAPPQPASTETAESPLGVPQAIAPSPTPSSPQNISGEQNKRSEIQDFKLESFTVEVGTIVTWTNLDKAPHTSTSGFPEAPSGEWDSGTLALGGSFSFAFEHLGSFPYFCEIHPNIMRATVEVVPTGSGSPPSQDLTTTFDVSLLAIEDHGDDDAEFVLRATALSVDFESVESEIELWAFDSDGSKTKVADLKEGDRIRLKVGEEEVRVRSGTNENLIDNEFHVLAQADSFEVFLKVTDSDGITFQDRVTVDFEVTNQVHLARQPLVID